MNRKTIIFAAVFLYHCGGTSTNDTDSISPNGGNGGSAGTNVGGSPPSRPQTSACRPISSCPTDLPGPTMVFVQCATGGLCIDGTEVTVKQYNTFLEQIDGIEQDKSCQWNVDLSPQKDCHYENGDNYPQACVDWCDALTYCQWAGKHLCFADWNDQITDNVRVEKNDWYNACSKGGTLIYPYGNEWDESSCNVYPSGLVRTSEVATFKECHGGYDDIWDMSGNVREWVDGCVDDDGMNSLCLAYGGSFSSTSKKDSTCSDAAGWPKSDAKPNLGFRCCF